MDIHAFWKDVLSQNREAIRTYFHEDAFVNWHCTNERFNVEEFIRANCDYPGKWDGNIERVEKIGDLMISVVNVYPTDGSASFHAVSFIRMIGDRIASVDEYWSDDGSAPAWRQKMNIGTPIK